MINAEPNQFINHNYYLKGVTRAIAVNQSGHHRESVKSPLRAGPLIAIKVGGTSYTGLQETQTGLALAAAILDRLLHHATSHET
jgi:hypothetical protein